MMGTITVPQDNLEDYFREDVEQLGINPDTAELKRVTVVSGEVKFLFVGDEASVDGAKSGDSE